MIKSREDEKIVPIKNIIKENIKSLLISSILWYILDIERCKPKQLVIINTSIILIKIKKIEKSFLDKLLERIPNKIKPERATKALERKDKKMFFPFGIMYKYFLNIILFIICR